MDPYWGTQMWGTWGRDPRGQDQDGEPFEIPMQGLGVFSCLKSAWPGFHPDFRGFGGEEGYIHEKFRQAGHRTLCLPWLRWIHRFGRPAGVTYPFTLEDRIRNYVIGFTELGLELTPILQHFSHYLPPRHVIAVTEQARSEMQESRRVPVAEKTLLPDMQLLVSVVIVVYNGERYLEAAVKSILEQTLHQIEVIIVNDGSTDTTGQIIQALACDPRVRPVQQNHLGISRAKHAGIALAQAKYIAMQDADDLSLPTRLEKQYALLQRCPDVGLVATLADLINEAGVVQVLSEARQQRRQALGRMNAHELRTLLFQMNCFVHGSVMMQKSACLAVGNYREELSLAEDYDLWLRMAERSALALLPEMLYQYRVHADTLSNKHAPLQQAKARIVRELAHERLQVGMDVLQQGGTAAFLARYGAELQAAEQANAIRPSRQLMEAPSSRPVLKPRGNHDELEDRASVSATLPFPLVPFTFLEKRTVQPQTSYLIASTARTGSYLLCEALSQTGLAGRPTEYFVGSMMLSLQREWGISSLSEYLNKVLELGTTPNGVFGMKAHLSQFRLLLSALQKIAVDQGLTGEDLLSTVFPHLSYIWITRRDKVQQAISFLKAAQTNLWWLTDQPPVPAPPPNAKIPLFDFEAIDRAVQAIALGESAWQEYFNGHAITPLVVTYEDLIQTYDATARSVLSYLNIPIPAHLGILEPRMKKQADGISQEWAERYHSLKRAQKVPLSMHKRLSSTISHPAETRGM
ncbi:MAG: glycosyltransferase [Ktedonobacteraceae bacterium]|nr:glycosyltransferase [Ktedonobacteraceae bacterium]